MATGVVRRLDELGRIVIPKEIRKTLKIREGESLEILCENDQVILKKHSHLSDIKVALESMLGSLVKSYDFDYILIEKEEITKTSKLFRSLVGELVDDDLSSGTFPNIKLNEKIDIPTSVVIKTIQMYGTPIAKIIFIKEDIEQDILLIDFVTSFIKDFLEK